MWKPKIQTQKKNTQKCKSETADAAKVHRVSPTGRRSTGSPSFCACLQLRTACPKCQRLPCRCTLGKAHCRSKQLAAEGAAGTAEVVAADDEEGVLPFRPSRLVRRLPCLPPSCPSSQPSCRPCRRPYLRRLLVAPAWVVLLPAAAPRQQAMEPKSCLARRIYKTTDPTELKTTTSREFKHRKHASTASAAGQNRRPSFLRPC